LNEVLKETTGELRGFCDEVLKQKRERVAREKREGKAAGEKDEMDILSLLVRSNDFSDEELVDQLLTFLAAGLVSFLFLTSPTFSPFPLS